METKTRTFLTGTSESPETWIDARRQLEARGHEVVGLDAPRESQHPVETRIEALFDAELVLTLDGWRDSSAAVIEVLTARSQGITVAPYRAA